MGLLLPDLRPPFPAKPPPVPGQAALTPQRRCTHLPAVWGRGQWGPRLQFRPHSSRETCFHKCWLQTSCGSISCSGAIIFVVGLEKKNLGMNSAGDPSARRVRLGCAARVPARRTQSAHNDARARRAHCTAACEMQPKPAEPPARSGRPCGRSYARSGDLRAGSPEPVLTSMQACGAAGAEGGVTVLGVRPRREGRRAQDTASAPLKPAGTPETGVL